MRISCIIGWTALSWHTMSESHHFELNSSYRGLKIWCLSLARPNHSNNKSRLWIPDQWQHVPKHSSSDQPDELVRTVIQLYHCYTTHAWHVNSIRFVNDDVWAYTFNFIMVSWVILALLRLENISPGQLHFTQYGIANCTMTINPEYIKNSELSLCQNPYHTISRGTSLSWNSISQYLGLDELHVTSHSIVSFDVCHRIAINSAFRDSFVMECHYRVKFQFTQHLNTTLH